MWSAEGTGLWRNRQRDKPSYYADSRAGCRVEFVFKHDANRRRRNGHPTKPYVYYCHVVDPQTRPKPSDRLFFTPPSGRLEETAFRQTRFRRRVITPRIHSERRRGARLKGSPNDGRNRIFTRPSKEAYEPKLVCEIKTKPRAAAAPGVFVRPERRIRSSLTAIRIFEKKKKKLSSEKTTTRRRWRYSLNAVYDVIGSRNLKIFIVFEIETDTTRYV